MPDKMGNWVHLMYLTMLVDLERVRRYSWGSACLATLYREMCRATDPDAKTMGGCVSLLQSWAWYRMPFIVARVNRTPSYHYYMISIVCIKLIIFHLLDGVAVD